MHIADIVPRSAAYWPNETAVIDDEKRLTYAELDQRSNQLANALLASGAKPGDRIALFAWNCAELVEAEVAFYKGGFVKVPVNARLSGEESVHVLNDADASVVIVDQAHASIVDEKRGDVPGLRQVIIIGSPDEHGYESLISKASTEMPSVPRDDNAIAVLHYTSGSSGVLKAAVQSFGNRMAVLIKYALDPDNRMSHGDLRAHVTPITHATGLLLMPTFFFGACNRIFSRFKVETLLSAIENEKITHVFVVPTILNRLVNSPDIRSHDLSSLRTIVYGAAPTAPSLVEKALEIFGPILCQWYGGGELTGAVTVLTREDHVKASTSNKQLFASCGRALGISDVKVVDEDGHPVKPGEIGEIVVRGPDVMQGYWQAPELTADCLKNGSYHTGDLAKVGESGYLYIVDRKKDMIISGGFNIYPAEIENVLMQHPALYEAVVVGVPDSEWGETPKGVVVLKPGATATEEELMVYCVEHLGKFKKPTSVDFVDELPKNPNGKIDRRKVRDEFWVGHERRVG